VDALGKKLQTNLEAGLSGADDDIERRQDVYGSNTFPEKPSRSLLVRAPILISIKCSYLHPAVFSVLYLTLCDQGCCYYKRDCHDIGVAACLGHGVFSSLRFVLFPQVLPYSHVSFKVVVKCLSKLRRSSLALPLPCPCRNAERTADKWVNIPQLGLSGGDKVELEGTAQHFRSNDSWRGTTKIFLIPGHCLPLIMVLMVEYPNGRDWTSMLCQDGRYEAKGKKEARLSCVTLSRPSLLASILPCESGASVSPSRPNGSYDGFMYRSFQATCLSKTRGRRRTSKKFVVEFEPSH
jgi:hypothetical protein